ncbi:MAG TPA: ParB/RepB/Spo0J family partition protein [Thermoanaerobaculia bacterium]|nr:ParB/RepB/Spo0J family partition protein [Thermoanaerobaculia bacterium]
MRHDRHFVDELATQTAPAVGRLVPLASIHPHPNQPRSTVGDLSELVASIREKGVLEPILIRPGRGSHPKEAAFEIISGERRYRAALEAGLYEIPAIEMDVTDEEALEIALVENLQREDLSPFEEADGYRVLAETHHHTHEEIAQAVGKSRSAITESLALLRMPPRVRDCVRALGVNSKSVLLELLKLDDEEQMLQLLERISTLGLAREAVRKEVKQVRRRAGASRDRAKPYTFSLAGPGKRYRLSLSFRQSSVEPEDLIQALEEALARLRRELAEAEDETIA